MRSVEYLKQVKTKHGIKTNRDLAKHLEMTEAAISHYMNGRRVMEEETCLRVALLLDIEPSRVLMAAGIDRAEKNGQRSLWEVFSKRMPTAASVLGAIVVTNLVTATSAEAAPLLAQALRTVCIM